MLDWLMKWSSDLNNQVRTSWFISMIQLTLKGAIEQPRIKRRFISYLSRHETDFMKISKYKVMKCL